MKRTISLIVITLIFVTSNVWAIVVSGSGLTKEMAINRCLHDAVEQYTGALVYGVTDVKDFTIQKDQIVAASLGYVKSYRIIKTSKIDDLILVTLDVKLSEDQIDTVVRDHVKLMTIEDVLLDYNNVSKRQDQIKKLIEMLKILAERPIHEKYGIIYEGYEIQRIGAEQIDVILNTRVTINPFYSRAYNEILKNLSEKKSSGNTWLLGGKYRLETGNLVNNRYYIPKDADIPNIDEVHAQIFINTKPTDKCREYRDNLMVVYSTTEFVKGFGKLFGKAFKQAYNEEDVTVNKKWENAAIRKSKIIPAEGLPLKIKYVIWDSTKIKDLKDLRLTIDACPAKEFVGHY